MNQQPDASNTGTSNTIKVELNETESRYDIMVGGQLAGFTEFRETDTEIAFTHTETFDEFAGQGLGRELVAGALSDAVTHGKTLVPYCPFVAKYIRRHPETAPDVRWPDSPRLS
ncbi:GNAT family N-acetyltransferase [Arthrobacter castelli]|uniref:GNAT family N-acetyltransferase n=1 Tax=Arthrobacter castelli TaxID=271431 RepID=UPI0004094774|nr:GNAT family N-acetyltransferase [Arthrobacter castelli]